MEYESHPVVSGEWMENLSRQQVPNLFIVGAAKAGTTSLYRYLSTHPDVCMASEKEPHYFSWQLDELRGADAQAQRQALDDYLDLFRGCGTPWRGEASITYLWPPHVPGRIRAISPEARILVMLRDPVERAYSHYRMDLRYGLNLDRTFLETLETELDPTRDLEEGVNNPYIELGRYHKHLSRYFEVFSEDQVLVLLLDELKSNPEAVLGRIATFLDISVSGFDEEEAQRVHNSHVQPRSWFAHRVRHNRTLHQVLRQILPGRVRQWLMETWDRLFLESARKPPMNPEARQLLTETYEPEIRRLEDLLGRPLPSLRRSWDRQ